MKHYAHRGLPLAAWLLFVVLYLVYMLHADRVQHALSGKAYAVKLPRDLSLHAKGEVLCNWGPWGIEPVNNKFEARLMFNGSVGTVAATSGTATMRFFFRSARDLYEVLDSSYALKAATNELLVGFFADTSRLENGVYTIGCYLRDDSGERFVWMNRFFEIVPGGPVEYSARPVVLPPAVVSRDLKFALEPIGKDKTSYIVEGCAVLARAEMNDYNAYLIIRGPDNAAKAFYAPLFTRMDVASMYGDSRAADSGFLVKIPQAAIASGEHTIKVALESRTTGSVIESEQLEAKNF